MRTATFMLLCLTLPSKPSGADSVAVENAKQGTLNWKITNPAVLPATYGGWPCALALSGNDCFSQAVIEGYASANSVNRGETIKLFVKTEEPYRIRIFRMGWYSGLGAREVTPADLLSPTPPRPANPQGCDRYCTSSSQYDQYGLVECDWTNPYVLAVPADWVSGVYLAKLTTENTGLESYIIFVVRDDERPSPYLFQTSVTTYQAYNAWGGTSLYANFSSANALGDTAGVKASFNRPYTQNFGSGEFLSWEYNMVRFLEREGYDVTYATNVDTHSNPRLLLSHRAFLSVGHDEYWSWEMRSNVEAARDQGVSLGFFGSNAVYWRIRFEPSTRGAQQPDRTVVVFRGRTAPPLDPLATDGDPGNDHLVTTRWRDNPVARPEQRLIGVQYERYDDSLHPGTHVVCLLGDVEVTNTANWPAWLHAGTNLTDGSTLPGIVGYETDLIDDINYPGTAPPGRVTLAESRFPRNPILPPPDSEGETPLASDKVKTHMTYYRAPSGAHVVATGTILWSWGLDDTYHFYPSPPLSDYVSPGGTFDYYCRPLPFPAASGGAQRITRNFLDQAALRGFSIDDAFVLQGTSAAPATFTVRLSSPSNSTTTVGYATADGTALAGTDYVATSGWLTFPPGATTATIDVTVIPVTGIRPDAAFFVTLHSPSTGTALLCDQGMATIGTVSVSPRVTAPGAPVTVTVAGGAIGTDWVGEYVAAAADSDQRVSGPGAPNWQWAQPSPISTFRMPTGPGVYNFRLFASGGYQRLGTSQIVTVTSATAAPPSVWIGDASVTEGTSGTTTMTFIVTLSPPSTVTTTVGFATADGTAAAGSDYLGSSGTLTFPPGATVRTVHVVVNNRATAYEPTKTSFVDLSSVSAGAVIRSGRGTGRIQSPFQTIFVDPLSTGPGGNVTVTVSGGSSPNDWVRLFADGALDQDQGPWSYVPLPRPATLSFAMPIAHGTYAFRLFANNSYCRLGTAAATVTQPPPASISVSPTTAPAGSPVTVTVTGGSSATEWIGQFRTTAADTDARVSGPGGPNWVYAGWPRPSTVTSFIMPAQVVPPVPGNDNTYNFRLFASGTSYKLDTSQTVTVTSPLTVQPTTTGPGGTVTVTVTGGNGPSDWVGHYEAGGADTDPRVSGPDAPNWTAAGWPRPSTITTFRMPTTPGTYNFRLFVGGTYEKLGTSQTVTVSQ